MECLPCQRRSGLRESETAGLSGLAEASRLGVLRDEPGGRPMHGACATGGIGESTCYAWGESPHTELRLACIAIQQAVEDAGPDLADVDGFVSFTDMRNLV